MNISNIFTTQRKLKRIDQLPALLKTIEEGGVVPPLRLSEFEDGSIQLEDGHHRFMAYWLSGRQELEEHEYELTYKDENHRVRFGFVTDLFDRIENEFRTLRVKDGECVQEFKV